ncbi:superoxide dismutase [Clostridium cellulovorans]|nr:superoxide dismutase [Clostridium cellulovorans]
MRRKIKIIQGITYIIFAAIALNFLNSSLPIKALSKEEQKFKVEPLPYAYDALEPYIDKETMELHHDKHYVTYTEKLNQAIDKYPELKKLTIEELLMSLDKLPDDIRRTVRNNGGGYYNHGFFFSIMSKSKKSEPNGKLKKDIEKSFDSFDKFKDDFKKASLDVFGSGWAWLIKDNDNQLKIITTGNQDSPIFDGIKPILGLDLWEHSYYLKYHEKRSDYIDNWWNVVDWDKIEAIYSGK